MQYFKGDDDERKIASVAISLFDQLAFQKREMYAGVYESAPLGDVLYDSRRSPLANAIPKSVFRIAFKEIFDAFVAVGTFEAYLTVFRKIFGESVVVDFTVPAAGKLQIDVEASGVELFNFVTRYIESNAYVIDQMIDDEGDNLVFQALAGFESQYELERMFFEMVPAGIYTEISLTLE